MPPRRATAAQRAECRQVAENRLCSRSVVCRRFPHTCKTARKGSRSFDREFSVGISRHSFGYAVSLERLAHALPRAERHARFCRVTRKGTRHAAAGCALAQLMLHRASHADPACVRHAARSRWHRANGQHAQEGRKIDAHRSAKAAEDVLIAEKVAGAGERTEYRRQSPEDLSLAARDRGFCRAQAHMRPAATRRSRFAISRAHCTLCRSLCALPCADSVAGDARGMLEVLTARRCNKRPRSWRSQRSQRPLHPGACRCALTSSTARWRHGRRATVLAGEVL
eukprot:1626305-Prymnesium_polylepis.1